MTIQSDNFFTGAQGSFSVGSSTVGKIVGTQNTNGTFTIVYEIDFDQTLANPATPSGLASGTVPSDQSGTAIGVAILDAFGNPLLINGTPNTAVTSGDQIDPSITATDDGGAAFTYTSGSGDVFVEKRDAAGQAVFGTSLAATGANERNSDIGEMDNGRLVVSYTSEQNGVKQLFAKFVDQTAAGVVVSAQITLDNDIASQSETALDVLEDGRPAIAYIEQGGAVGRVTLLNASGFGANSIVVANNARQLIDIDVAALPNGGFVVTWAEEGVSADEAFVARYDANGNQLGSTRSVTSDPTIDQVEVVTTETNAFSVLVDSQNPDGSGSNVVYEFTEFGSFKGGIGGGQGGNAETSLLETVGDSVFVLYGNDNGPLSNGNYTAINYGVREQAFGTDADDVLFGNSGGRVLTLDVEAGAGDDQLFVNIGEVSYDGGAGIDSIDYSLTDKPITLLSSGVISRPFVSSVLTDVLVGDGFIPTVERIVADTEDRFGNAVTDNTIDGENSANSQFVVNLQSETLTIILDRPTGTRSLVFDVENFDTVKGTGNDDQITGSIADETLTGGDGADRLSGWAGDDDLFGNADNDTLDGGLGADRLFGGTGVDTAFYGSASVGVTADLQVASLNTGEAAGDTYFNVENLRGSNFDDGLRGDGGNNRVDGRGGNDFLFGRAGDDILVGGDGNDSLLGGAGADLHFGGDGIDRALYGDSATGLTIDLKFGGLSTGIAAGDRFFDVEILQGTQQADSLRGTNDAETIFGQDGNDVLAGRGGDDTLRAGNGNDVIRGDGGNDFVAGGAGNDTFVFNAPGEGIDTIQDFVVNQDTIRLDDLGFTSLTGGSRLDAAHFVNGAVALDADDYILYDNGALYYDADGSGSGAAVQFATLLNSAALDQDDILVL